MKQREPHCPNCNVLLVEIGPYVADLGWIGQTPAVMFKCQNDDDVCGYFTIIGEKAIVGAEFVEVFEA